MSLSEVLELDYLDEQRANFRFYINYKSKLKIQIQNVTVWVSAKGNRANTFYPENLTLAKIVNLLLTFPYIDRYRWSVEEACE